MHRLIQFITNSPNKNLEQRLTLLKTNGWNPQVGDLVQMIYDDFPFQTGENLSFHVSFRD